MEIEKKGAGNGPGDKSGTAKNSNDYGNELSSGTIGSEGGHDNGASTLRALKKKYANDLPEKKK